MVTIVDVSFDIRTLSGKIEADLKDPKSEKGGSYLAKDDVYGIELLVPQNQVDVDGTLTIYVGQKKLFESDVRDLGNNANEIELANVINSGWKISMFLDYHAQKLGKYKMSLRLRNE